MGNQLNKGRNSSIELLRILMMLQIIFLHVASRGRYQANAIELGDNHELIMWTIWLLSRCPVFVFIMITGYFTIYSKAKNHRKKILQVYLPMYFYSLAIPLAVGLTGVGKVTADDAVRSFFPLLARPWYFMTLYVLLMVFVPYLNVVLSRISRREYAALLGVMGFLFCVWQPLAKMEFSKEIFHIGTVFSTEGGKSIYDFVFIYALGGFLRRFVAIGSQPDVSGQIDPAAGQKLRIRWPNYMNLLIFIELGLINVLLVYALPDYRAIVAYNDNPLVVLQCVFLFLFFAGMEFHSRLINRISALNLGIYMIHEHGLIRQFLWRDIVPTHRLSFYDSNFYLLDIALICVAIYLVCAFLEWLRTLLFQFVGWIFRRRSASSRLQSTS